MIKIKPSKRNTNKHTDQGMELLQKSIEKIGVIESISVADDGTIISGHARKEIFDKKGMKAKEIELAPNEFAVIKTNIKPNTKEYYEAQILANTTAHNNFNLDNDLIDEIAVEFDINIEEVGVEVVEAEINYEPILLPDTNYSDVTKEQIQKEAEKLASQMIRHKNKIECICPNCGEEFEIDG